MSKIFPDAKDYKTITTKISNDLRKRIEAQTGHELLPGQRDQFQHFEMTGDKGTVIGYIIAASQKGEFGAVEFVVGLDTTFMIQDLYVQRARERDQSFKNRDFLDLFKGKPLKSWNTFEALYTGKKTPGTTAVMQGLVKEFVAFKELVLKNSVKE